MVGMDKPQTERFVNALGNLLQVVDAAQINLSGADVQVLADSLRIVRATREVIESGDVVLLDDEEYERLIESDRDLYGRIRRGRGEGEEKDPSGE